MSRSFEALHAILFRLLPTVEGRRMIGLMWSSEGQWHFILYVRENHKITKAASIIGMGTFLSRILGFLRDMVIANFFGTGMAADAFFVAFRIPNLWRRLVGEGSLTISFIPVYTEYTTQRSEEDTREVTHIAFTIAGVVLLALTLFGILFSPFLIRIIAPGWFARYPETFSLTVTLNQIIFPYLFFMGLFALCMGILNSLRHFFAPAIAPIFLNISIILSVLLFYSVFEKPVMTLALGVLAGGIIQFLFQLPFLIEERGELPVQFQFSPSGHQTDRFSYDPRAHRNCGLSTQCFH